MGRPHLVNSLGVVLKDSEARLVMGPMVLNRWQRRWPLEYENLSLAEDFLQPGDYVFKDDAKAGYHHIPIHPDYWKYLVVEWQGKYYYFKNAKTAPVLLKKWKRKKQSLNKDDSFLKWQAAQAEIVLKNLDKQDEKTSQYNIKQLHATINAYQKALSIKNTAGNGGNTPGSVAPRRCSSRLAAATASKKQ
ncbi:hypothetical protein NADE_006864 [Nannochloris sp. 'desiccata']|nr:hypothetical protein NADE_006864 [Chlorella desiccata (nom. nud.)]